MVDLISYLLAAVSVLTAIPVFVLLSEIISAAIVVRQETWSTQGTSPDRIAVLVPAHNEVLGIQATLTDIKKQLRPGDRLLVVADNCTDNTAAVALAAGAEVTERNDLTKIGKGYAIDCGVRYFRTSPPSIVVIVDADCRLLSESIIRLSRACAATGRPIQALYLMTPPDNCPINYKVATFAFRVKNWVRPLGLLAFKLPCQLMGTGMAFPWEVINSANLATGSEVEDLKLGLELAQKGKAPLFCPSAGVHSHFPSVIEGAETQRKRWERGHMGVIVRLVPAFLLAAMTQRNMPLLALVIDAAVPPLTLLGGLVGSMLFLSGLGFLCGLHSSALGVSGTAFIAYVFAVFVSWSEFGRDVLPLRSVVSIMPYIFGKLSLYRQIAFRQRVPAQWIRTARGSSDQTDRSER